MQRVHRANPCMPTHKHSCLWGMFTDSKRWLTRFFFRLRLGARDNVHLFRNKHTKQITATNHHWAQPSSTLNAPMLPNGTKIFATVVIFIKPQSGPSQLKDLSSYGHQTFGHLTRFTSGITVTSCCARLLEPCTILPYTMRTEQRSKNGQSRRNTQDLAPRTRTVKSPMIQYRWVAKHDAFVFNLVSTPAVYRTGRRL